MIVKPSGGVFIAVRSTCVSFYTITIDSKNTKKGYSRIVCVYTLVIMFAVYLMYFCT